jgi:hypothetical protein
MVHGHAVAVRQHGLNLRHVLLGQGEVVRQHSW